MEINEFNVRSRLNRFVKRLEKAGMITQKMPDATYRKVRILASACGQFRKITFITTHHREVSVDIDLFAVLFHSATYLNQAFYDVVDAVQYFDQQAKAANA